MKNKKLLQLASFVLALLVCFGSLPLSFTANAVSAFWESESLSTEPTDTANESSQTPTTYESAAYFTDEKAGGIREVSERREENVKHFAMTNGSYTAVVYAHPVHRKDANGVWQDIDNTLTLQSVKGVSLYTTADQRTMFAPSFVANSTVFALNENGYAIGMALVSNQLGTANAAKGTVTNTATRKTQTYYDTLAEASAINNRSSIRYANVKANTDLEYVLDGNNVKENIIVKAAATSYVYQFTLTLTGLTPTLYPSGAIGLCDSKTGERQYVIPAPFMYDADGALSEDVAYTLTPTTARGTYTLTVTADPDWINAEGRAFPVTIDPPLYVSHPEADTYVSETYPEDCNAYSYYLYTGSGNIAYVKFEMPTIPTGATLESASIEMKYDASVSDGSVSVSAHRVLQSWDENTMTYDSKASYSATALSTHSFNPNASIYNIDFDITAAAVAWASGTPNYGIAFVGSEQYVDDVAGFEAIDAYGIDGNDLAGPTMTVNYSQYIPDGVYAFENAYNSQSMWMTVQGGNPWAGAYLQHQSTSPLTASNFANASFFKISRVVGTERYIIRSMLNNNLTFYVASDGTVRTKEIPSNDADVAAADTFHLFYVDGFYQIVPASNTEVVIALSGTPSDSKLRGVAYGDFGDNEFWTLSAYTGNHCYGGGLSDFSVYIIGNTYLFNTYAWCTVADVQSYNFSVHSSYTNKVSGTWNASARTFTATIHDDGYLLFCLNLINSAGVSTVVNIARIAKLPIEPGIYFMKNESLAKYMQVDDGAAPNYDATEISSELHSLTGGSQQKWEFVHLGDGEYKILSVASGNALTAPSGVNESVTLNPYTGAQNQKWLITILEDPRSYEFSAAFYVNTPIYGKYKISPKSNPNYYLAVGDTTSSTDVPNIEMRSIRSDGKDEWLLHLQMDYALQYIGRDDGVTSEPTKLWIAETDFQRTGKNGYGAVTATKEEVLLHLSSTTFLTIFTHGYKCNDTPNPCSIRLTNDVLLTREDINALDDDAFDALKFVFFSSCYAGSDCNCGDNLVKTVYDKGADAVLGFTVAVESTELELWTPFFWEYLATGATINEAIAHADEMVARRLSGRTPESILTSAQYRYFLGDGSIVLFSPSN